MNSNSQNMSDIPSVEISLVPTRLLSDVLNQVYGYIEDAGDSDLIDRIEELDRNIFPLGDGKVRSVDE